MTGGTAYVLDLDDTCLKGLFNPQLIRVGATRGSDEGVQAVKELIYKHLEATDSERGKEILADWGSFVDKFWKVVPLPPVMAKPTVAVKSLAATSPVVAVMADAKP